MKVRTVHHFGAAQSACGIAGLASLLLVGLFASCRQQPPPVLPPLPAGTWPSRSVSFDEVKPVIDGRCAVCHGCYDAPCQLVLTSTAGLDRGVSKEVVYDGGRIVPADPSRLFVDEKTTEGWRKRGFFSVLETKTESRNNLMRLMLELGAAHSFPTGEKLPAEVDLDINRELSCRTPEKFGKYVKAHPLGGMPYGTASLATGELRLLSGWLDSGAPHDVASPAVPNRAIEQVADWEIFLNGTSLRERITFRYLYEHWFIAHLYFDDLPEGPFFRIVRSITPPGQPIDEIATRRPYDAPGVERFWYRLRPITSTIVHKTHSIYPIGEARKKRLTELFLASDWTPSAFPSYDHEKASNPFVTFAEVPARARYQYLLDDAQYFVMTFIRGPVCRGQTAVDVIQDHFFAAFLDPDHDISVTDPAFLSATKEYLNLPAEHLSRLALGEFFGQYGIEQRAYLDRREDAYAAADPENKGLGLDAIWDGDGHNPNALLTIFRHWDNATVVRGWVGGLPKTAWVLDYPIFERIYYDLVAGFDVFGSVSHQAATRLYMDHLRMQAENNFISFLPADRREEIHASWYVGATKSLDYKRVDYLRDTERGTRVHYREGDVEAELFTQILNANRAVAGPPDLLNRCSDKPCERPDATALEKRAEAVLQSLAAVRGPWVAELPEVTRLRIRAGRESIAYTLVHNRDHTNVAYMFDEEARLIPEGDTLTIVPGYLGSYPNFVFEVDAGELEEFHRLLTGVTDDADFERLADRYGVRRTSPDFWATMDWMLADFRNRRPTEAGLFDLGRYKNF
ncbi:MAG: fatty acid cis/trans isomerase [Myxococcota bacterium]